jgi:thioredoxin-dependent adenylylsulfate APS reductase
MIELVAPPRLTDPEIAALAARFAERPPEELLGWAAAAFGTRIALATSFQADGMVILDMAQRVAPGLRVITVDSGRLPQETHDLIDHVRERYGIAVEVFTPAAGEVERFVGEHGPNAFYRSQELRVRCCEIRKVTPLTRALRGLDAWITGQRRDHSSTRRAIARIERDVAHGGIVKLNPLADWSTEQVWDYLRAHDVPHNALYDRGFTSIGCAPCTRATRPGEDPRAGRWWWEATATKECGMHCRVDWNALRA